MINAVKILSSDKMKKDEVIGYKMHRKMNMHKCGMWFDL